MLSPAELAARIRRRRALQIQVAIGAAVLIGFGGIFLFGGRSGEKRSFSEPVPPGDSAPPSPRPSVTPASPGSGRGTG